MAQPMADDPSESPTNDFIKGLWRENPTFVQVLGMCPTLAVTNSAINGLAMGLATAAVLVASNGMVSTVRHRIPHHARIATFILIIATFVTVADYVIEAINLELHKALGAFIPLIVANCQILGHAEAFAAKHSVRRSLMDGLGAGLGFTFALLLLGSVREILGRGSLFDVAVLPDAFERWVIMLLPSGGFLTLGVWLLIFAWFKQRNIRHGAQA